MVGRYRKKDLWQVFERRQDPQTCWPSQSRWFRHSGRTHFLGRTRHFEESSYPTTTAIRLIPRNVLDDLRLWLDFLEQAQRGISLNILTIREPTTLYLADACKHGIRGFNVFRGRAWRFAIPPDLKNRATLNVLEFFASIVGPWVDLLQRNLPEISCIWS
jgi:hypothetical protein